MMDPNANAPRERTAQEIAKDIEAQEIADGHRYQTQEFRNAREAERPGSDFKKARDAKKSAAPKKNLKDASPKGGERIAKVLARAGLASRREIERLVGLGKIAVNGRILETPAVLVSAQDVITVEGKPIGKAEPTRLWRYHKPVGLMTTHNDPQGRPTVFEKLPQPLPRVISVGRLDLNSEGLLLLTNDGELARALEMPTSGWVRRYRVRALGNTSQSALDKLQHGTTVEGVIYGPMEATLDKKVDKADGRANVWLTIAITEGKNREVRKVLESIGLKVNRLIRLAYGPFQLGNLESGEVEEVGPRVIRELLSDKIDPRNMPVEGASQTRDTASARPPRESGAPEGRRGGGDRFRSDKPAAEKPRFGKSTRPSAGFGGKRDFAEKRDFKPRDFSERPRFEGDGESRDARPFTPGEDRPREWKPRAASDRSPRGDFKKPFTPREDRGGGERKAYGDKPRFDRGADRPQGERYQGERSFKPREDRGGGERKAYGDKPRFDRSQGERPAFKKPYTSREGAPPSGEAGAYERAKREFGGGDRPKRDFGDRPQGERSFKPREDRGGGERKSYGDKPRFDRGPSDRAGNDERKPYGAGKPSGARSYGARSDGDRPAFKPREDRGADGAERGPRKSFGDKPRFDKGGSTDGFRGGGYKSSAPRSGGYKDGGKPGGARPGGFKPGGARPSSRPGGGPTGGKPRRDRD